MRMDVRKLLWTGIAFCLALSAAEPTGTIAGTVTDPSSASVVGAKITVTNAATGLTRAANSNTDGGYVFPLLPVGTYNISVENAGFRRFEQRGVQVKADSSANVPVVLQLGAVTDTVTVQANAEMVETRSGTLSQTVNQQKIVELPLNGRNAATLVLLAPGTADAEPGQQPRQRRYPAGRDLPRRAVDHLQRRARGRRQLPTRRR